MTETETTLTNVQALIETGKAHLKEYNFKANVIHAQKCFSLAYSLCTQNLGKDAIINIDILGLLAAAHNYHIGLSTPSEEVIALLEEMKRIQLLNYESTHPDLIKTYKRLATSYSQSKKYKLALENYFQALENQSVDQDEYDKDMAHTLERIGDVYNNLVKTKKAREYYVRALEMNEQASGDNQAVLASLQSKIARVTPIIPSSASSYDGFMACHSFA